MSRVKVGGDWRYEDQLDGIALRSDERVRVLWPYGAEDYKVEIESSSVTISDMGHPTDLPVTRAYIRATINGTAARVRLADIDVHVVRPAAVASRAKYKRCGVTARKKKAS